MGLFLTNDLAQSFMIKGVYKLPFKFLGGEVWITDSILTLIIVVIGLIIFGICVNVVFKKAKEVPTGFQNVMEMAVDFVDNMSKGNLGDKALSFANYFGTIILFLLVANLSGLFGLRAPTGDYGVTFALGMFTFFIIQFQGFKNKGFGNITELFQPIPLLCPINIIGEIANPITLSLRLFANLLSGIIILGLWYGMIPLLGRIGIPVFLHIYCDIFSGAIQAYVFTMLSQVYISNKL